MTKWKLPCSTILSVFPPKSSRIAFEKEISPLLNRRTGVRGDCGSPFEVRFSYKARIDALHQQFPRLSRGGLIPKWIRRSGSRRGWSNLGIQHCTCSVHAFTFATRCVSNGYDDQKISPIVLGEHKIKKEQARGIIFNESSSCAEVNCVNDCEEIYVELAIYNNAEKDLFLFVSGQHKVGEVGIEALCVVRWFPFLSPHTCCNL